MTDDVGKAAALLLRQLRANVLALLTLAALALGPAQAQLAYSAPPAPAAPPNASPSSPSTQRLPVITWTVLDYPPASILHNGAAPTSPAELGTGIVDRMMQEVIARLPQYRHEFRLANRQRIWASMRQGDHICDANAMKTAAREQWAYFAPAVLVPPMALVVRASDRSQFTQGAPSVSLRELLKKDFKGGLEPSRSYGPAVDQVLALADTTSSNGAATSPSAGTSTSGGTLLNLVALGRYDYTLEYPMVVQYTQQNRALATPLAVLPLREAQDWSVGYIACSRTAWGKAVLRDVDDALRAAFRSPAYRDILAAWLPPAYLRANQQRINAFYDSRPPSPALARATNARTGDTP